MTRSGGPIAGSHDVLILAERGDSEHTVYTGARTREVLETKLLPVGWFGSLEVVASTRPANGARRIGPDPHPVASTVIFRYVRMTG